MSEPFLGEIRLFAGTFAPVGWLACNGQIVSISEYDALYTLLGTTYGGDGQSTFCLPDLRGRVPMAQGQGLGLTPRVLGQSFGTESVTLTTQQIPAHTHILEVSGGGGTQATPGGMLPATSTAGLYLPATPPATLIPFAPSAIGSYGGSLPHQNLMPSTAITFIICTAGIYPTQA